MTLQSWPRQRRDALLGTVCLLFVVRSVVAEEEANTAPEGAVEPTKAITLRVVDAEGKPAAGAKVGDYATWQVDDAELPEMHGFGDPREDIEPQLTDEDGLYRLDAATVAADQMFGPQAAYAIAGSRELAGLAELGSADAEGVVTIAMHPWCAVEVTIDSTELAKLGQPFELSKCYVYWKQIRPFFSRSTGKHVRFLLPPGKYRYSAYGSRLVDYVVQEFEIAPGERSKRIVVDLPATRLAHLIGHPAPELVEIESWRYSKPLRLADLHGQIVLLNFWGTWCGPCVGSMPKLIDLHNEFHDDGLTVIAVHTALRGSGEGIDERLAAAGEKHWGSGGLPFAVALDGGAVPNDVRKHFGATTGEYGIHTWPTSILIDRQGNVIGEFDYRAEIARDVLKEVLATTDAD